jgi:hypothetical protein
LNLEGLMPLDPLEIRRGALVFPSLTQVENHYAIEVLKRQATAPDPDPSGPVPWNLSATSRPNSRWPI